LTEKELEKQLADQGIEVQGMAKQLQKLCRKDNIPVRVQERKISEGWMGKVKGIIQVLWE
jgi:hypothetical protein